MSTDRRAVNVVLAVLDIEQRELAERMGYEPRYVTNVMNGFTKASRPLRRAFGETVAALILGNGDEANDVYPAEPLMELIEKRAAEAPSRRDFFADLGVNIQSYRQRETVSGADIDRICCDLGVHPSSLYPEFGTVFDRSSSGRCDLDGEEREAS